MVNFRFHLVSLTAVFLALAAGITIGAGVVDRATVDQIERRLEEVDGRREDTNRQNDELRSDLTRWGNFAEESGDRLVAGQLTGTPVVVVATNGVNRDLVNSVRSALVTAGAEIDGTIWFTGRWA
ncbi:MAG: copper transporter, partial [Actinomycetota bacterium]|nr:copper transporter [Actinomycetota bacterium]